jgi:hypothetical protein
MSLYSKLLSILALLAIQAFAQTPVVVQDVKPDCLLYFVLTGAAANSASFDNRQVGCTTWTMAYTSSVYASLILTVQDAPDVAGTPGVWVTFAGTVMAGVNPNGAVTQASTSLAGYYPWMRLALTKGVGAGTIRGVLYGYKERTTQAILVWGGSPSGAPAFCPLSAVVTLAGIGTTQVIPLTLAQSIRICHISFALTGPSAVTLSSAPAAACAGAVAVSGAYANVTAIALDFGVSPLTLPAGGSLCVNLAAAVNAGGIVEYTVY